MKSKEENNSESRRPEAYKIHLYAWKGDCIECGSCVNHDRDQGKVAKDTNEEMW